MATTIGQFNRVWTDYTTKLLIGGGLTDEAKAETRPLFLTLSAKFEKQFGVSIQRVNSIPQDQEIAGDTLVALKGWVTRINQMVEEDYLEWCGFH